MLALADIQPVRIEVLTVILAPAPATVTPIAVVKPIPAPAAIAIASIVAVPAVAVAAVAFVLRRLLHQELARGIRLCGQCRRDVIHRDVVRVGVLAHHRLENVLVLRLQRLGDGVHELELAALVDFVNGRQLHLLDRRVGHALDGTQHTALAGGDEENGLAGAACAAGAADAVHVAFRVVRDVVVEHVGDALNVEAAGGNVGGNQDVEAAVAKLVDGALTLLLRNVAVNRGGGEAAGTQFLSEFLGLVLGAHEHDHRLELGDLEDAGDRVELVTVRREQVTLSDVGVGAGLGLHRDLSRIVEVLLGDLADTIGHRRGKQRDLLGVRRVLEDAFDVFLETHVEHLIGLIEHEEAQVRDVE